jgi:hypothetical protein
VFRLLAFLVLLALALLAQAPAWLVADRVAAATGGVAQVRNATGTWWKGGGEAVVPLAATGTTAASLGTVRWRVDRIDLGARSLTLTVEQSPGGPRPIVATIGSGGATAAGSFRLPATVLARLPQAAGWSVHGAVVAESDRLAWDGQRAAGIVKFRWPNAALAPSGSPESIALGEVTGRVEFGPAGPAVAVTNSGGSVQLEGALEPRSGQATLKLQPRANAPPEVSAWLQSRFGPVPPGGYALAYTLPRR